MESEKLIHIRQIVRQVILPLVQAIYVEEPGDINQFCAQYFLDLQKQESTNKISADGGNKNTETQFIAKDEVDECVKKSNEAEIPDVPRSYIQGSASLPVLSGKNTEGLILRETSSWSQPLQNSEDDKRRPIVNLADAMSRIGDQLSLVDINSEVPEIEMKGDTSMALKNEEAMKFEAGNQIENESKPCTGMNSSDEDHTSSVLPSAPPYTENIKFLCDTHTDTTKCEQDSSNCKFKNSSFTGGKVDESLKLSNRDLDSPMSCYHDMKKLGGKLSPNSSFGFIPHLQEYESEGSAEKEQHKCSDEFCCKRRTREQIEKLTKQFTEVFQSFANEFNSSESNFDSSLQQAKEFSDIIQGQTKECSPCTELPLQSSDELETDNERMHSIVEESNLLENNSVNVEEINKSSKDYEQFSKAESIESVEEFLATFDDSGVETERIDCLKIEADDSYNGQDKDSQESEDSYKPTILNLEHYTDTDIIDDDPTSFRNNEEDEIPRNFESRPKVDGIWKKKWYEVHPRLDNVRSSFRQRGPMPHRAHRVTFSNRNQFMPGIGEAGDTPPDRRYHVIDSMIERLESASESNLQTTASPSQSKESGNLHGSLSAGEISHRMSCAGRVACNFTNRGSMNSGTPHVSSKGGSLSWRDRSPMPSVDYTQRMERACNDSQRELRGTNKISDVPCGRNPLRDFPTRFELNTNVDAPDAKEVENTYFDSRNNQYILESDIKDADDHRNGKESMQQDFEDESIRIASLYQEAFDDVQNRDPYTNVENLNQGVSYDEESETLNACSEFQPETFDKNLKRYTNKLRKCCSGNFPCTHGEFIESFEEESSNNVTETKEGTEIKMANSNLDSLKTEDKNTSQNVESFAKIEPGLNSPCGDIASSNFNGCENNEDISPDSNTVAVNVAANSSDIPEISPGYFEEMLENVLTRQRETLENDYEVLNFSCYSGSDSSDMESSDDTSTDNLNESNETFDV